MPKSLSFAQELSFNFHIPLFNKNIRRHYILDFGKWKAFMVKKSLKKLAKKNDLFSNFYFQGIRKNRSENVYQHHEESIFHDIEL